ncbi:MAG: hypothetical protein QE273_06155 [Verrucomicrobiales bacterium]|nr:hypothetical protein [Verrucomicrobiales bacterium]
MKIRPVLIAAVLSGLVNGSFAREIRIFTNNSGKKIEAELLDLTEGKVRLIAITKRLARYCFVTFSLTERGRLGDG